MVDSVDSSLRPPWPVRWALGVPAAAVACLWFFSRAWGVPWAWGDPWHRYSLATVATVATVAAVAWMLAVRVQWSWMRPGRERMMALIAVAAAGALVVYWAGWWLPRGLVMAAMPVAALAVFEGSLGSGRPHALLLRTAVTLAAIGVSMLLYSLPLGWPPIMKAVVAGGVLTLAAAVWRWAEEPWMRVTSQRLVRSVIFAAGVWLPLVWWEPRALMLEFVRLENASFLGLVMLVASARPEAGRSGEPQVRRSVAWAALGLAVAAGAGCAWAAGREAASPRNVFFGVALGALVLAACLAVPGPRGSKWFLPKWWPELALVVMAIAPWVW